MKLKDGDLNYLGLELVDLINHSPQVTTPSQYATSRKFKHQTSISHDTRAMDSMELDDEKWPDPLNKRKYPHSIMEEAWIPDWIPGRVGSRKSNRKSLDNQFSTSSKTGNDFVHRYFSIRTKKIPSTLARKSISTDASGTREDQLEIDDPLDDTHNIEGIKIHDVFAPKPLQIKREEILTSEILTPDPPNISAVDKNTHRTPPAVYINNEKLKPLKIFRKEIPSTACYDKILADIHYSHHEEPNSLDTPHLIHDDNLQFSLSQAQPERTPTRKTWTSNMSFIDEALHTNDFIHLDEGARVVAENLASCAIHGRKDKYIKEDLAPKPLRIRKVRRVSLESVGTESMAFAEDIMPKPLQLRRRQDSGIGEDSVPEPLSIRKAKYTKSESSCSTDTGTNTDDSTRDPLGIKLHRYSSAKDTCVPKPLTIRKFNCLSNRSSAYSNSPGISRGVVHYNYESESPGDENKQNRLRWYQHFYNCRPLMRCLDGADDEFLAQTMYERLLEETKHHAEETVPEDFRGELVVRSFWDSVRSRLRETDEEKSNEKEHIGESHEEVWHDEGYKSNVQTDTDTETESDSWETPSTVSYWKPTSSKRDTIDYIVGLYGRSPIEYAITCSPSWSSPWRM